MAGAKSSEELGWESVPYPAKKSHTYLNCAEKKFKDLTVKK